MSLVGGAVGVVADAAVVVSCGAGDVVLKFALVFFFIVIHDLGRCAHGVGAEVFGLDLHEVGSSEVGHAELAEDVVDDRRGHFDVVVAMDGAVWLEAGEDERLGELLERDSVLEAEGDGDGEAVHERPEGGAFAVHIDEDFAEGSVFEFTGSEVDLVSADAGLLGVASAASGHDSSLADVAVDEFGGDTLDFCMRRKS